MASRLMTGDERLLAFTASPTPPSASPAADAVSPNTASPAAAPTDVPMPEADGTAAAAATWRPHDFAAVQEALTLIGRAVRQYHTYPETSPLCRDAIAAAQKALVGLNSREHLAFRVTPRTLVIDDVHVGAGSIVEYELARRLHRAQVATVEIARTSTTRDLVRFCKDLSGFGDSMTKPPTRFIDLLAEHGVSQITVRPAHRPEVMHVGALSEPVRRLVEHEKQRRAQLFAAGGPVQHLYPPDKGWVRVDPSTPHDTFSLVDLAVLIDNPAQVAVALMRLTGDEAETASDPRVAFEAKFSDLATIFAAVDPRLARLLFSKLSRAVLELEPDRRSRLLKRTVLPGLLDGKLDGTVLSDFPDVDLAEALCLLLDLETASPDVLTTALDRLGLPQERRQAIVPLLEERLQARDKPRSNAYGHDHAIETYARKLIEMKPGEARSFAEYSGFDLSVTDQTRTAVTGLVQAIADTDIDATELGSRYGLVRLEPNPELVATFMARTMLLFERLERNQQWPVIVQWAARFRELAVSLRESRPDVADAIVTGLQRFCSIPRALSIAELYKADGASRALAEAFADGFGQAAAESFVDALDSPGSAAAARPLVTLMVDHAEQFAPPLAARLMTCGVTARQAIVKVLGAAGSTYLAPVSALLKDADETTGREVLRALAKMGTANAAAAVAACMQSDQPWSHTAAEEALWHFPAPLAAAQVRKLLANRDFVLAHPDVAGRLMDRAAQAGTTGLAPVLETIAPLRFRFWKPALVKVAMKARHLLHAS